MKKALIIGLCSSFLFGCSAFNPPQPTTPEEKFQLEMQKRQALLMLSGGLLQASQARPAPIPPPQTVNMNVHYW